MCLEKVKDFEVKLNKKKEGWGWKAFRQTPHGLTSIYFKHHFRTPHTHNKWIEAMSYNYSIRDIKSYKTGFHIFTKNADAEKWSEVHCGDTVKKVKFRHVLIKGSDSFRGFKTIVAKEIFIPKD